MKLREIESGITVGHCNETYLGVPAQLLVEKNYIHYAYNNDAQSFYSLARRK